MPAGPKWWNDLFLPKGQESFMTVLYKIVLFFGAWKVLRFSWSTLTILWQYVICKFVPNSLHARYGKKSEKSWALVTGASDGIGLAMCKVLAAEHGFNIIMVARSEEKLN